MPRIALNPWRRACVAGMIAGLTVVLGGCSHTMGEFSRTAANVPAAYPLAREAVLEDGDAALKPAALVEEDVAPAKALPPAAMAAETVVPTDKYPNLNAVPPPEKGKLLTPEQKAKVVAELEALARNQGTALAKERAAEKGSCDGLSAADLKKRMLQGLC